MQRENLSDRSKALGLHIHKVHDSAGVDIFDVFIAGSGPIGATYAKLLVDQGFNVCMVEIGDLHDSLHPGSHQKNEIRFQKDVDMFVRVIQGALSTVSVPASTMFNPTIDPSVWSDPELGGQVTISHGRNPHQKAHNNLGAEAVTHCVGGMSTHWTCATPEFLKGVERPQIFPDDEAKDDLEWKNLYHAARTLIGTSDTQFDRSIRHNVVLNALREDAAYKARGVKALPLACHRIGETPYVRWHSAENVFGKYLFRDMPEPKSGRGIFRLVANTRCSRIWRDELEPGHISFVEVQDLIAAMKDGPDKANFIINARIFVVAAGELMPCYNQILAASKLGGLRSQQKDANVLIPNLGKYITEQPYISSSFPFRELEKVDDITSSTHPEWWQEAVGAHQTQYPEDPLPIPIQDPEPQVTIPATKERPWHTQIHRDAFSYGEVGPSVDPRIVVDLRFFGMQDGVKENRVLFEDKVEDMFGMPQPTFEYKPTPKYALQATHMMRDMTQVANTLGGYLPGSSPQFMTPGLALHLGGSVRLGQDEKNESVADYNSLVWKTMNLYVAGNGIIPTPFAANPTLTSMALAIRSAKDISDHLQALKDHKDHGRWRWSTSGSKDLVAGTDILPTPDDWFEWTDPKHPNYPDHENLRNLESIVMY
ncbi:putative pyranose oxidase [Vararia minispora EC-137]|uniref:Pyranose oxidase n=1 Tax=Vararia minispora EC-137 TaxID=1314806 RepID=A0ACB8QHX0_9AGAM|nr:putative pyranose oxidase [Vararia minispora EC-137]